MVSYRYRRHSLLAGFLGAALLAGAPNLAHADQGKWWDPEKGGKRVKKGQSYRAPAWRDRGHNNSGQRYWRPWRGRRVYRDYVHVRVGRGSYGRPYRGWRYYVAPSYYYPRHIVYVRPVRFFISADALIGGFGISARYADPGDVYGCNFCDARFGAFHAYETHVKHCSGAPRGYRVVARNWEHDPWDDDDWRDDRQWEHEGD